MKRLTTSVLFVLVMVGLTASMAIAQGGNGLIKDEVSYSNDIEPVVKNFCVTCHAGEKPEGDFVLTDYSVVRKYVEKGNLLERINDIEDPMPPSGLMPQYARRLFKIWANSGFIEKGKPAGQKAPKMNYADFKPPKITPLDIEKSGFDLLEKVQGHWVGTMNLMGQDFDWMAFDFRAIAPSHVHGIFEGGTIGNLFTSFFVTKFNGKRTIMARNGGILNGIYRTSYFVLVQAEERQNRWGQKENYYRLVDAYGGKDIMWMELTFSKSGLVFNAYTSRFGLTAPPRPHMRFVGKPMHLELSKSAARRVGFPKNELDIDFSKGLPKPDWGSVDSPQTSASYLWDAEASSLSDLATASKDPYPLEKMPFVAKLTVTVDRNEKIKGKPLLIYLSSKALTHKTGKFITEYGYLSDDVGNSLLMFPEIAGTQNEFTFTYLHPGEYFLTVIADMNNDSLPSPGDVAHASRKIRVEPKSDSKIRVADVVVQN